MTKFLIFGGGLLWIASLVYLTLGLGTSYSISGGAERNTLFGLAVAIFVAGIVAVFVLIGSSVWSSRQERKQWE